MTPIEAFGLVAGFASIVGLVLAILYARREASRVKDLRFETQIPHFPLVSSSSLKGFGVSISYGSGENQEVVEDLFVSHLAFLNLGKESIRREDIAPANPLRVEISGPESWRSLWSPPPEKSSA